MAGARKLAEAGMAMAEHRQLDEMERWCMLRGQVLIRRVVEHVLAMEV